MKINVLVIRVGCAPVVAEIENGLPQMQEIVSGYIQVVMLDDDDSEPGVLLVCNEEGKIHKLPFNRNVPAMAPLPWPLLCEDVAKHIPENVFVVVSAPDLAAPGQRGFHHIYGDFFLAREDGSGEFASLSAEDIAAWTTRLSL